MYALLAAALLPAFGLMYYVYKKDTVEKEPFGLVARVFVLGAVAGILAAFIEVAIVSALESALPQGTLLIILEFFVGVAMVEEALKYAALATVIRNRAFNYVFDGIVYGVAAALGFAALENVFYVLEGGFGVALMRALFSVPGHCADGVVMGCFVGLAKYHSVRGNKSTAFGFYVLAYVLPVIEHGIYDAALSVENDAMILVALAVEVIFVIIAAVLVHRMSKRDQAIYPYQEIAQQPDAAQFQQPVQQQFQQPQPQPVQPQFQQQFQQPVQQQQFQQPVQPQVQQPVQPQQAQQVQPPAQQQTYQPPTQQ